MKYNGTEKIFYCLGAKPEDRLLILTDKQTQIAARIINEDYKGESEIVFLPDKKTQDIPKRFHKKMKEADIILIAASQSWYHTPTRRRAKYTWRKRVATCTGMTPDMLDTGALCANYNQVARLTEQLASYYLDKEGIRITTQRGTDISADITGRTCHYETGLYKRPGTGGNIPAGELPIAPVEGTANGTIVYDITFADIGKLCSPLYIEIRNGLVNGSIGGENAEDIFNLIREDSRMRNLAEISIGTNPEAIIYNRPLIEQEKKCGTGHIALGSNKVFGGTVNGPHRDGVFWEPTLTLDGRERITIMQDGKIPKALISDSLVKWLSEYELVI